MKVAALVILLFLTLTDRTVADDTADAGLTAESEIRDAREKFNRAIEQKNIDAIRPIFAPNYHIVTGRSAQFHGAENEYQNWRKLFADDPSFICNREPREIRTNLDWGLAEELGNWNCEYTADGEKITSSGVYAAKWQQAENGAWLLQTEVFTTLACRGIESGCRRPDALAVKP